MDRAKGAGLSHFLEHAWTAHSRGGGASPCPYRAPPKSRLRPNLRNCPDVRSTICARDGARCFAANHHPRLVLIFSAAALRKNCRKTPTASCRRPRNENSIASSRPLQKIPTARIELPRRIKPGAVLVRDWKGKTHRVTVLDKGFAYEERTYPSLSEIAREITGTRWNGPKFFGLRPADRSSDEQSTAKAPPKRGRPRKSSLAVKPSTTTEVGHGL